MKLIRNIPDFIEAVSFFSNTTARERRIFSDMIAFDGTEIIFGTVKDYYYSGGFLIDNIGNNMLVISDDAIIRLRKMHPDNQFTKIVGRSDLNNQAKI